MTDTSSEPVIHEFRYSHNLFKSACAVLVIFGLAFYLGLTAMTNHRGLIIDRIFYFSESQATFIYWALCIMLSCLGLLATYSIVLGSRSKKRIALTASGILVRKPRSSQEMSVPYAAIMSAEKRQIKTGRSGQVVNLIILKLKSGKKINISQSLMASPEAFNDFAYQLALQLRSASGSLPPVGS